MSQKDNGLKLDWTSGAALPYGLFLPVEKSDTTVYLIFEACEMSPKDKSLRGVSTYYRLQHAAVFLDVVSAIGEEREVLRGAVRNLWAVYRYHQHYIGFLGGGVSESDFNEIAEKYATTPKRLERGQLARAVQVVLPLIEDEEITPKDLAVVLGADPNQLELPIGEEPPHCPHAEIC